MIEIYLNPDNTDSIINIDNPKGIEESIRAAKELLNEL